MLRAVNRIIACTGTGIVVIVNITLLHNLCSFITCENLSFVSALSSGFDLAGVIIRYDLVIPRICVAGNTADENHTCCRNAAGVVAVTHVRNCAADSADFVLFRTLGTRNLERYRAFVIGLADLASLPTDSSDINAAVGFAAVADCTLVVAFAR